MEKKKIKNMEKNNSPNKETEIAAELLAKIFIDQINFGRIKNKNKDEKQ